MLDILMYVLAAIGIFIVGVLLIAILLLIRQQIVYRTNPSDLVKTRFVNVFAKFVMWVLRVDIEVLGLENLPTDQAFLITSNHQSWADPFVLQRIGVLMAYVGKVELENKPVVHEMFMITDGLYLNRDDIRASVKVIGEASKRLKNGRNFVIFPEGTRSKTGELGSFKAGSLKVATKAGAPIVPVTMTNNKQILKSFPRKVETQVIIDKPLYQEYYQDMKEMQIIKEIESTVAKNLK